MKYTYTALVEMAQDYGHDYASAQEIMRLLIETSRQHLHNYEDYEMSKQVWMLYRWKVKFLKKVYWNEEVEITTLVNEVNKLYAYRQFSIVRDGEIVVRAYSLWVLVDLDQRKVIRVPKNLRLKIEGETEFPKETVNGIKKLEAQGSEFKIKTQRRDVDQNRHVNNIVYIDYILEAMEAMEPGFNDHYRIKDLEIIYAKEIVYPNEIIIDCEQLEENTYIYTLWDDEKNIKHAYLKIEFTSADLD